MSIDNFKNISFKQRSHCMVCSKPLESPLVNLPNFPLTEIYTQKKLEEKIGFLDQFFHVCDHWGIGTHMFDQTEMLYLLICVERLLALISNDLSL